MNYSNEEILKALLIISETCGNYTTCENCPFSDSEIRINNCKINEVPPNEWEINTKPPIWKVLI